MNTWLERWDRRYTERVQLLVDVLPALAQEPRFALKGGTAINLFEHDLPRLSVDIDLTWLPTHDYVEDSKLITAALGRLADVLRGRPWQLHVQTSMGEGGRITRLVISRARARVQIETTPVMRGTVHPARKMVVRPRVEEVFGFVEAQVLDFADLYAGKPAAALSRQHPRDLFDVGLLLEDERADPGFVARISTGSCLKAGSSRAVTWWRGGLGWLTSTSAHSSGRRFSNPAYRTCTRSPAVRGQRCLLTRHCRPWRPACPRCPRSRPSNARIWPWRAGDHILARGYQPVTPRRAPWNAESA
jgi:hypothetical protein